ncbi:putative lysozyme-like protein isoform X2 [Drosophila nasuta]|nr:putative lysozyme-like protein isoform X2 [Drosophila nasuta]XP_060664942.1 putative lysozyme-like protein isoform X2 [Drosophila nasuta]XP_060664943.1 putative lysozyme-like protein isoform X2 [Drosophila nasuta]XP_060664944.1 putative lysozyme-like protein isoform X2 [Drosophila nasuta]
MATATMQPTGGLGPAYDRQQSTDSGWDNPFRPGGDLSREADEIVSMIRGGKPITPTEDRTIGNGNAQHGDDNCNGATTAIGESVTKTNLSQNQATAQNGTNSHGSKVEGSTGGGGGGGGAGGKSTAVAGNGKGGGGGGESNNGVTSLAQVSKQVVPGPTSASHVVIDEKKNKKKGCCVVQ